MANFQHWLTIHSPQLLTGVRQWLCAIIKTGSAYHLPVVECTERERLPQLNVTMWVLSGVLPMVYFGTLQSPVTSREVCITYCTKIIGYSRGTNV